MSIYKEKSSYYLICLVIIYLYIANAINGFATFFSVSTAGVVWCLKAIIAIYFLVSVPTMFKMLNGNMILLSIASVVVSLCNLLLFPEQQVYFIDTMVIFFSTCLPVALVSITISDPRYLKDCLVNTARLLALLSSLLLIGNFMGYLSFYKDSYSMGFGYSLSIPILVLLLRLIKDDDKKLIDVFSLIVLVIALLLFGSRGPLVGVLLFTLFSFYRYSSKSKKLYSLLSVTLAILLGLFGYKFIVDSLYLFVEAGGISSRTVNMILK